MKKKNCIELHAFDILFFGGRAFLYQTEKSPFIPK